jgi:hypothetical protein
VKPPSDDENSSKQTENKMLRHKVKQPWKKPKMFEEGEENMQGREKEGAFIWFVSLPHHHRIVVGCHPPDQGHESCSWSGWMRGFEK